MRSLLWFTLGAAVASLGYMAPAIADYRRMMKGEGRDVLVLEPYTADEADTIDWRRA